MKKLPKKVVERLEEIKKQGKLRLTIIEWFANISTKENHVTLYIDTDPKPEIKLNWSALGSVNIETALKFTNDLSMMIALAKEFEKRLK